VILWVRKIDHLYSTGSLKFTHHFGWNCFFTLGEQLILQLSVTQSNNPPPWLSVASVLGAAARAARDNLFGSIRGATSLVGGTGIGCC
jgi:hypothetical protein